MVGHSVFYRILPSWWGWAWIHNRLWKLLGAYRVLSLFEWVSEWWLSEWVNKSKTLLIAIFSFKWSRRLVTRGWRTKDNNLAGAESDWRVHGVCLWGCGHCGIPVLVFCTGISNLPEILHCRIHNLFLFPYFPHVRVFTGCALPWFFSHKCNEQWIKLWI